MTTPASRKLQLSGHRFLMRRMERALLYGDVSSDAGSVLAPRISLAVGAVLAAVILAAGMVLPQLRSPVSVEASGAVGGVGRTAVGPTPSG